MKYTIPSKVEVARIDMAGGFCPIPVIMADPFGWFPKPHRASTYDVHIKRVGRYFSR